MFLNRNIIVFQLSVNRVAGHYFRKIGGCLHGHYFHHWYQFSSPKDVLNLQDSRKTWLKIGTFLFIHLFSPSQKPLLRRNISFYHTCIRNIYVMLLKIFERKYYSHTSYIFIYNYIVHEVSKSRQIGLIINFNKQMLPNFTKKSSIINFNKQMLQTLQRKMSIINLK